MNRIMMQLAISIIAFVFSSGKSFTGETTFPVGESGENIRLFVDRIPLDVNPLSVDDKNSSIAIQYRRTFSSVSRSRRDLARFIGFLEGTTRIDVPEWWERRLLARRVNNGDSFFPSKEAEDGETLWTESGKHWFSGVDRVQPRESGVLLGRKSNEYEVSDEIMQRIYGYRYQPEPYPLAANLNEKSVLLFNDNTLACVSRTTSTIAWLHELDEIPFVGGASGPDDIYYEVFFSNGNVAGFYGWNYGMKCIICEELTGQTLFRFNSEFVRPNSAKVKP